uniref:Uncharacterized protein n=1 Tax=Ditylenchus dipsaci TaxID=166011 RepID=A0A915DHN0_9BILA
MYKTEWNPTLASTAKEMLKVRPTPVSFVVMLREIKGDLDLAYSKTAKIGCAVEYWKNEKSVKTAKLIGRKEKKYRARMICQSPIAVNEILYEVGKPCKACEEEHSCDKTAGMCMTDGFRRRHPSTTSSSSDEIVRPKKKSRY